MDKAHDDNNPARLLWTNVMNVFNVIFILVQTSILIVGFVFITYAINSLKKLSFRVVFASFNLTNSYLTFNDNHAFDFQLQ